MLQKRPDPVVIRESERGFVLIAAIWLLVLGGSIVSILMVRTMAASRVVVTDGTDTRSRFALKSAVDTVIADILFSGPRSQWAALPAEGAIAIDNQMIEVTVTSDNGRVDVNEADPKLIDATLREQGVSATSRKAVVDQLLSRRALKQPVTSIPDLDRVLSGAGSISPGSSCLGDAFTMSSGMTVPELNKAPAIVVRALGSPTGAGSSPRASAMDLLRINVRTSVGVRRVALARTTGQKGTAALFVQWSDGSVCEN
jgi:general secretion pathway protein K